MHHTVSGFVAVSTLVAALFASLDTRADIVQGDTWIHNGAGTCGTLKLGDNYGNPMGQMRGCSDSLIFETVSLSDGSVTNSVSLTPYNAWFRKRVIITQGSQTAGIWYLGTNGVQSQFVGSKVHSSTQSDEEWGVWLDNAWRFWFKGNGAAYKYGSSSWTVASDERVKKNILPYYDGLEALRHIHPVWYQYNGAAGSPNDGTYYVGILAQEVEQIAPYMVASEPTVDQSFGPIKAVDTGAFTYMLINAAKQLSDENDQLRDDLKQLREDVAELRRAVNDIRRK